MTIFLVHVHRQVYVYNSVQIEAKNEEEALQKAQDFCTAENRCESYNEEFHSHWQQSDSDGDIELSGDIEECRAQSESEPTEQDVPQLDRGFGT